LAATFIPASMSRDIRHTGYFRPNDVSPQTGLSFHLREGVWYNFRLIIDSGGFEMDIPEFPSVDTLRKLWWLHDSFWHAALVKELGFEQSMRDQILFFAWESRGYWFSGCVTYVVVVSLVRKEL